MHTSKEGSDMLHLISFAPSIFHNSVCCHTICTGSQPVANYAVCLAACRRLCGQPTNIPATVSVCLIINGDPTSTSRDIILQVHKPSSEDSNHANVIFLREYDHGVLVTETVLRVADKDKHRCGIKCISKIFLAPEQHSWSKRSVCLPHSA